MSPTCSTIAQFRHVLDFKQRVKIQVIIEKKDCLRINKVNFKQCVQIAIYVYVLPVLLTLPVLPVLLTPPVLLTNYYAIATVHKADV